MVPSQRTPFCSLSAAMILMSSYMSLVTSCSVPIRVANFSVFDDRETGADGEYEVVHYKYDTGVYKRFADFETFLRARWEMVDKRLREKGYSSS